MAPDLVTRRVSSLVTRATSKMDDFDRQDFDERVADEAVEFKEISIAVRLF